MCIQLQQLLLTYTTMIPEMI